MTSLPSLLEDIPSPVLTWYGREGDRIDLNGRSLARWVAKTANLALDLGVGADDVVGVDLGATWRAPVWWLACWHLGAGVAVAGSGLPVAVAVTAEDRSWPAGAGERVVVALPSLAQRAAAAPPGSIDYAAEISTYADRLPPAGPEPRAALVGADGSARSYAGITAAPLPGRHLLGPDADPADFAGIWSGRGSVVWHDGVDGDRLDRLTATEGVLAG